MSLRTAANYFIRNDVQNILKKISGFDLNKIYSLKYNPNLKNSEIQLLTNKELSLERKNSNERAKLLLQMPPFIPARDNSNEVLSLDKNLYPLNLTNSNYLFIDISLEIPNHERMIVVREKDGLLRKADYDEREKTLQVYFPVDGKSKLKSQIFKTNNLEESLRKKNYTLILNKACLEFEPNDPEYIRISHRVFEYVNEVRDFEHLYSTRYFGTMVFYLIWYKKIENLLLFFIQKNKIDDCYDLINLYSIVHEKNNKFLQHLDDKSTDKEKLKVFIKYELKKTDQIEQALPNDIKTA